MSRLKVGVMEDGRYEAVSLDIVLPVLHGKLAEELVLAVHTVEAALTRIYSNGISD